MPEKNTSDPIQSAAGSFGAWQLCLTVLVLSTKLPSGWFMVRDIKRENYPAYKLKLFLNCLSVGEHNIFGTKTIIYL